MHKKSKVMSKAVALFMCATMVLPLASYYGSIDVSYGQEVSSPLNGKSFKTIKVSDIEVVDADTGEKIMDRLEFSFKDIADELYDESEKGSFDLVSSNGMLSSLEFKSMEYDEETSDFYKLTLKDNSKYTMNEVAFNANKYSGEGKLEPHNPKLTNNDQQGYIVSIKLTKKNTADNQNTVVENKESSSNDGNHTNTNMAGITKKVKKTRRLIEIFEGKSRIEDGTLEFIIRDSKSKEDRTHPGDPMPMGELKKDTISYPFVHGESYTIELADNDKYTMDPVRVEFKKIEGDEFHDLFIEGTNKVCHELQLKSKPVGTEIIISDIKIVDSEGNPAKEGMEFKVYNMNDKRFIDTYKVQSGKLHGIKMTKDVRYKIGPKDLNTYTMIKDDIHAPFNYINVFAKENGKPAVETDLLGKKTDGEEVTQLKVVKNEKLKGTAPTNAKYQDIQMILSDISVPNSPVPVTADKISFDIYGAGTVQRVTSENGAVSFKMTQGADYVAKIVVSEKHNYKMDAFGIKLDSDGQVIKTSDNTKIGTFNLFQGSYMIRMFVLDDLGYMVREGQKFEVKGDNGSIQNVENVPGWLTFRADRDVNYTITMPENSTYKMKPIKFAVRRYQNTYTALLDGTTSTKLTYIPIERKDQSSNPNDGMERIYDPNEQYEAETNPGGGCGDGDCNLQTERISVPAIKVTKNGASLNKNIEFILFNSTRQKYEGKVIARDGQLPKMNLTAGTKYILMLENNDYYMPNVYFKTGKDGERVYNFKDNHVVDNLTVYDRTPGDSTLRTNVSIDLFYKGQPLKEDVRFQLISAFDTIDVTSKNGVIEAALKEDETYVLKALSNKYEVPVFPLVIKDKSEWQDANQKSNKYHQNKYLFNHSTCDSVSKIDLVDKGEAEMNTTSVTCPSGKTTVSGMKFNNLQLFVEPVNKTEFPSLKSRDVKVFNINLINPFRCEVSKIAEGNFTIKRDLDEKRQVSKVFFLKDNGQEEDLEFSQEGRFITVKTRSMTLYPLVVEYGSNSTINSKRDEINKNKTKKDEEKKNEAKNNKELVSRMAGRNRELTSVEISKETFKNGADNVVLVNGYSTADALAALPYAKYLNGPVLLMGRDRIDNEVKNEIVRLGAKNITIIGGTSSIADNFVEGQFRNLNVSRISGLDRYETSINIARKYINKVGNSKNLIIASGTGIVDALSVANLGDKEMGPVVLTRPEQMNLSLEELIRDKDIKNILMLGGTTSISSDVEAKLKKKNISVDRVAGKDRYATSIALAKRFSKSKHLVVANGSDSAYVDALSVGLYAYKNKAGIVITDKSNFEQLEGYIKSEGIKTIKLVGGNSSVSNIMEKGLLGLVK